MKYSRRTILAGGLFASVAVAMAACGAPLPTPAVPTVAPPKPAEPTKPAPAAEKPADKPVAAAPAAPAAAEKPADKPGTAAPAAAKPAVGAGPAAVIRMHSRTGSEGTKPEAAIKVIKERWPNIDVKLETFPGDEFTQKILTLAAGGQIGDLMWGSPNNYHISVGNNLYADLMPMVQSSNYDLKPFFKGVMEYLTASDGKLYSLPYKAHPGAPVIWFNKEMFAKEGLPNGPQPKTFDELTEIAKKMTKGGTSGNTETWGFLPNNSINHAMNCLVRSWGVEPVEPILKAKKSLMDGPKHLEAFTWLHSMYQRHKVSPVPGPGIDVGEQVLVAGKAAMFQASSSTKGAAAAIGNKFTLANVLMPPGPGGQVGSIMIPDNFGMYQKSKSPNEAFTVLGYFCGKEHGIRLGLPEGGGSWTCGARTDVFYSDELMKSTPNHKVFADIVEKTGAPWYPDNFRLNEYETTLTQGYQKIMLNATPPSAASMKDLQSQLQAVLDRPKP